MINKLCNTEIKVTVKLDYLQARPLFKDRKKFKQMADPALKGQYPVRGLYQALAISAMCVQEEPSLRPVVADLVAALAYLASQNYDPYASPAKNSRKFQSSSDSLSPNDEKAETTIE